MKIRNFKRLVQAISEFKKYPVSSSTVKAIIQYFAVSPLLFGIILFGYSYSKKTKKKPPIAVNGPVAASVEEVLLIGNSHPYYNSGVPIHLTEFLKNDATSPESFIKETSFSGYSLQDHLSNAGTLAKLEERSKEFEH